MSAKNNGGPAFPVPAHTATDGRTHDGGISLRDWFAGQVLAQIDIEQASGKWWASGIAEFAYDVADAMLKAREQ